MPDDPLVPPPPTAKRHHILSPVTGKRLCDGGPDGRSDQSYASLDNAYRGSVGLGPLPCRECVQAATLAMTGGGHA